MTACSRDPAARGTLLLSRSDVASVLTLDECIRAVEAAFRSHAEGRTLGPGVLGIRAPEGGFHIKAAGLVTTRTWFAVKCNGNFPHNPARQRPPIQGSILLQDGDNGAPLAVLDSIEITTLRTGATTAVAAKHLARPDARTATIVGCGTQGHVNLRALSRVLHLERVFAVDAEAARAERFADRMGRELGLQVERVGDLSRALRDSDVCVTCTPSRQAIVLAADVRPGTFVAGVGADDEGKQELDPELFARALVVVDNLEQCAAIGDLQHALRSGRVTRASVHAELSEVVSGRRPGRRSSDETFLFDSTGVALADVGATVAAYERAVERGIGTYLELGK